MAKKRKRKKAKESPQLARLRVSIELDARRFTEEEKKIINELSPQELDMLIRMRKKWGRAFRGKWPLGLVPV